MEQKNGKVKIPNPSQPHYNQRPPSQRNRSEWPNALLRIILNHNERINAHPERKDYHKIPLIRGPMQKNLKQQQVKSLPTQKGFFLHNR
jgi:hypothetical protein